MFEIRTNERFEAIGAGLVAGLCAAGLFAAVIAVSGCAEAEFGPDTGPDTAPATCEMLTDCDFNEVCRDGVCVPGDYPTDGGMDGATDAGPGGDGAETSGPVDAGPCRGRCTPGQRCTDAGCVSRCDPGCRAGQKCRDIGQGYQCYERCETALSVEGCEQPSTLCWDVAPEGQGTDLLCKPSECAEDGECPADGTCLQFDRDFGACAPSGQLKVGETCGRRPMTFCEQGAYCLRGAGPGTEGTCVKLCDPWADTPECPSGRRCSVFRYDEGAYRLIALHQGFCNANVAESPGEPMDACSSAQTLCDHATRCWEDASGPVCARWCRPGAGDCQGLEDAFARSPICDNYTFAGERRLGRCVPRCTKEEHCGSGERCVQGVCRTPCQAKADCCGGPGSCQWTCRDGLCR